MEWEWTLAHPLEDVEDIIKMAQEYEDEVDTVIKTDPAVMRKNLTVATTVQVFDKSREFIAVCRHLSDDKLMGYCWFDRFGYTVYSNQEISNAKFHHVDLNLGLRTRVHLIHEMIDQHILWASNYNIPIICSTSIRGEHDGFMKIHKKRGFLVNGSYAWITTQKGTEGFKNAG